MSITVTVAQTKARLSELLRRAEINRERITITRRGRPVAEIRPVSASEPPEEMHWVDAMLGLFADHPEACDEIDRVYAERSRHMPREVGL